MKHFLIATLLFCFLLHIPGAEGQESNSEIESVDQYQSEQAPDLIAQATDDAGVDDEVITQDSTGTAEEPPVEDPVEEDPTIWQEFWGWLKLNWVAFLLGLIGVIEIVVNLTPTQKDNAWFIWLREIIQSIIPNRRSGGGTHSKSK
jgi:hypothetical protein